MRRSRSLAGNSQNNIHEQVAMRPRVKGGVSRLGVSQIVAKLYTTSGMRITICNAIANIWIQDNYISPDGFL